MNKTIQQQINEKIELLPTYHQLAFGVILTERYLPNYFAFHFVEQWGNPMILLNGIDLLKNIVKDQTFDPNELMLVNQFIEDETPDTDDFPSTLLASLALNVSSMLYECFEFVSTKKVNHIKNCSQLTFETLEMYIQKKDNLAHNLSVKELNKHIENDSLLGNEIEFQLNLLSELSTDEQINHTLYIKKTMKAPKLILSSMS